ncbi:hypothetical protein H2204_003354 [Knufia peltigerae]|uniref:Major facilitator superfamily (MFS) profile domain-containing protein n=1 Tax=Knufia peltigerae TaxID=1002370 RepID=A0AA39D0N2_9EURO|nr:hypothetical protein H2204_003354 [Knufia peltigerae]
MEADRSQTISNSPKPGTVALEVESAESIRPLALDAVDDISDKEWRRIVHKIDRRLITATGLMMAVSLMDRTNLGSAMIAGMSKDLGMSIGNRYKRFAAFYLISCVGSSLSGVLAAGFMNMGGVGGLAPWRYVFIWEGVLTILIGLIGAYLIVDFPQAALNSRSFLTPDELGHVIRKLEQDRGEVDEIKFSWSAYLRSGLDPKVWAFGLIFILLTGLTVTSDRSTTIVSYSIAFFMPIIINDRMDVGIVGAQALGTPPYIFAGIYMCVQGWLADKHRQRSVFLIWNSIQSIVGLCILSYTSTAGVQYFGIFLVASASNANVPAVMAYQSNNIRGTWKRAFCSASLITLGGTGGIIGSLVYRAEDAPRYLPGIWASMGFCGFTIVLVGILSLHFWTLNRKADREGVAIEGMIGFRYTL